MFLANNIFLNATCKLGEIAQRRRCFMAIVFVEMVNIKIKDESAVVVVWSSMLIGIKSRIKALQVAIRSNLIVSHAMTITLQKSLNRLGSFANEGEKNYCHWVCSCLLTLLNVTKLIAMQQLHVVGAVFYNAQGRWLWHSIFSRQLFSGLTITNINMSWLVLIGFDWICFLNKPGSFWMMCS